ncbi:hypothetical protein GGI59_006455 [Rhizobium lentis]|uniref:Uncharacterized protein n=1 Tax=Rhizobium lentis TaxID=1138194 RepID=A0A7W8XKZ3_9HYPH|nr:hypothetical protein [Rhizobium lentis]MBB5554133.1 hypothetical protein [Rhizobium lentis]MBB5564746.1 hypothetical protein [Rhizobium lentis]MBB5571237.1 hypothetical protein [Rhizobium lentis]
MSVIAKKVGFTAGHFQAILQTGSVNAVLSVRVPARSGLISGFA